MQIHKTLFISMVSFISFMISSCNSSDEELFRTPSEGEISFTSSINVASRATSTHFENNDAISVFAFKNGTGFTSNIYASNRKYSYASSQFIASDLGNAILAPDDNSPLAFQAIYPYNASASSTFDFNVNTDQSAANNYTLSDLMTASTIATTDQVPNLKFSHRLANVIVNVTFDKAPAEEVKVNFQQVTTTASVDLTTGTFKGIGAPTKSVRFSPNGTNSYKAILPPQSIERGIEWIVITAGDKSYTYKTEKKIEWKSGIQYTYNIHIDAEGNIVFIAFINPWGEDAEEPTTEKKLTKMVQTYTENGASSQYIYKFAYDSKGRLASYQGSSQQTFEIPEELITFTYSGDTIVSTCTMIENEISQVYETVTYVLNNEGAIKKMNIKRDLKKFDLTFTYTNGYLTKIENIKNQFMTCTWADGLLTETYIDATNNTKFSFSADSPTPARQIPSTIALIFIDNIFDVLVETEYYTSAMQAAAYLNILGKIPDKMPTEIIEPDGTQKMSYTKDADNYMTKLESQNSYGGEISSTVMNFIY